jgi:hypothetical protein
MTVDVNVTVHRSDPSEAGATAPSTLNETDILLAQYAAIVQVLTSIFSEYWQTNAFFMATASLGVATIGSNRDDFVSAPWPSVLGFGLLFLFLLWIWLLSLRRHALYIESHIQYAREIETRIPGLEMYHRRHAQRNRYRLSVTRVWGIVPVVFALTVAVMVVDGLVSS